MRILALALLTLLIVPLAAAKQAEDFRIVLAPGETPRFESANATATLAEEVAGERVAWDIATAKTWLVGTIESRGYFDVARPKQILPEVGDEGVRAARLRATGVDDRWRFFTDVRESTFDTADEGATIANLSLEKGVARILVAFPVNATLGEATLRLTRDVLPTAFSLGEVANLTHWSFYFETTTEEFAFGDLILRKLPGGEPIRNPTSIPALVQRFPIQGLDPETDYVFHVEFEDWSGNRAKSGQVEVRTPAAPFIPPPVVTGVYPAPNATAPATAALIANYTNPTGTISSVTLIVDKRPVPPEAFRIEEHRILYTPREPLKPGTHVARVEITNSDGGKGTYQWTFTVEGATGARTPAPGLALAFAAAAVIALAMRRCA